MNKNLYRLLHGDIQIEAELELGKRLGFSSLSHIFLYAVLIYSTPLLERHYALGAYVGASIAIISLSRFFLSRFQNKFYLKKRRLWLLLFDISLVATAGLWGFLSAEILRHEGFTSPMTTIIFLILSGITAGAANSLNPSFKRAITFIAISLGIPFVLLVSLAISEATPSTGIATIFLIYFVFLSMQVRSQHKIFWNLLKTKKEITDLNYALDEQVKERTKQLITTEAKLIESAKMAALGEMAGGIAHEINTPLAVIALMAQQAREFINEKSVDMNVMGQMMDTINETVTRISKVIVGLRSFSREAGLDPSTTVPVKRIVDDTLSLCHQKLEYAQIKVRVLPMDESLGIHCRPVQISQVLLNLVSNACDAVRGRPEPWIEISAQPTSDGVEISVTDSGSGVSETVRKKLFQPFFTTKPVGEGTGLGLSISSGIMKSHKGTLILDDKSPNTRFLVFVPHP